jgi:hypothetical protein
LKTFALVFVDVEIKINMACVQGIDRNDGGALDKTPSIRYTVPVLKKCA